MAPRSFLQARQNPIFHSFLIFSKTEADAYMVSHISVDLQSSGVETKAVIEFLGDEKIMAMSIPIVCAAFPLDTAHHPSSLTSPLSSDVSLRSLCRIVSFACESVQSALKPVLESGPDRSVSIDVGSQGGMSFSNRRRAPSGDLIRSAARLATRLVYRLWECQKKEAHTPRGDFSLVKDEVSKVVDIMLEVAERCLDVAWGSGAVHVRLSSFLFFRNGVLGITQCEIYASRNDAVGFGGCESRRFHERQSESTEGISVVFR